MTVGTETWRTIHYSTIVNLATKWFSCCVHSKNEMDTLTLVWLSQLQALNHNVSQTTIIEQL